MHLALSEADVEAVRAFNRRLARMPRFRMRTRLDPHVLTGLLRLSQVGADWKARRQGVRVETRRVAGVTVRVLSPAGPPRGVVLDIHGGGWVVGNARMDDAMNVAAVLACGVAVVSVDYRRSGQAPIPRQMRECLAVAQWLLAAREYRSLPVFVTGESAGGHLAAATLLALSPEQRRRIAGAILFYGVFDLTGTPSVRKAGPDTLVLHAPSMIDTMRRFTGGLSDEERRRAPFSPLYGDLEGVPPALFFGGELDPLIDDTRLMARRWAEHAPVECHILPEAPHGYLHFPTPLREKVLSRARAWMGERLVQPGRPTA